MTHSTFDEIMLEFGNIRNYLESLTDEPILFVEVNHYERGALVTQAKKTEQTDLFIA